MRANEAANSRKTMARQGAIPGVIGQPPSPFRLWWAREVSRLSGRSSQERRLKAIVVTVLS
ncbi:hypothetical protein ACFL9T_17195 [Thermodesulfobacteriota bacterium]